MRVCFVSRRYWPAVSGMSVYAESLLRELVTLGHEVVMVSQYRGDEEGTRIYGGGPPPDDRVPSGVRVVALEQRGEQAVHATGVADFEADVAEMTATVQRLHAADPFDVVHAQYGYPTGLAALEAARREGLPAVVSIQGGDGHWVGTCCATHKTAMLRVLDLTPSVLIGSASFRDEVVGHHGTAPSRFTVVGGATDTVRFHPREDRQAGDVADPPVLLFHGRVDARKGVLDLLDALDRLDRDVRLLVSGIGPDLDEVSRRAADDPRVELVGYVHPVDAPEVYRRADVFVSPTYSEGFSNTVLEAMATGLPVVSTRSVGVVDCVRHDDNGLLHEVGDVDGLVDQLRRVLDDEALRRRLADTALDEVRGRYAWPVLAGRVCAIYEELMGSAPLAHLPDDLTDCGPVDPACPYRVKPHLL